MNVSAIAMNSLRANESLRPPTPVDSNGESVAEAKELRKAYTQFVGETFYGSLLKSMRATVGKPAYFHGGIAEEMFQGRLDQQISTEMAQSGGRDLAASLFEQQFPKEAALLRNAQSGAGLDRLAELNTLPRR